MNTDRLTDDTARGMDMILGAITKPMNTKPKAQHSPLPWLIGGANMGPLPLFYMNDGAPQYIPGIRLPNVDDKCVCAETETVANIRLFIHSVNTLPAVEAKAASLIAALEAIIERWDTPLWKDVEPTGAVINRARAALALAKEKP